MAYDGDEDDCILCIVHLVQETGSSTYVIRLLRGHTVGSICQAVSQSH